MQEKSVNSFSIYAEYMDLFELLPTEEEQGQLVWKIFKYMFYDEIPVLNDNQTRIFNNLKRPLDKSKSQSKNVTKKKPNENQNKTKKEPNKNQETYQTKTHQDVNVNVNVNDNVDVNILEKIGYGEEKPLKEKFGEYQNVLLTKKEYESLQTAYSNYEELIKFLDEYIEEKGYKAKNHYLSIKRWVVGAVKEKFEKQNKQIKSNNPFREIAEEEGMI